jgi:hypothetical protein
MLKPGDEQILKDKGISVQQIEEQLRAFALGFPFLEIKSAAEINNGIVKMDEISIPVFISEWEKYLGTNATILKFVPASGAASRMFKDLYEFVESEKNVPENDFEKKFFANVRDFAFYDDLNNVCIQNNGLSIDELVGQQAYKTVVKNLLEANGLNYGSLPKGLLKFHSYTNGKRTPMQEHLVEGALYAFYFGKCQHSFYSFERTSQLVRKIFSRIRIGFRKGV